MAKVVCQWCGLESEPEPECEWCHRELKPLAAVPVAADADIATEDEEEPVFIAPLVERLELFLAVVAVAIAVCMVGAHFNPSFWGLYMIAGAAISGFALSVYQLVDSVDDAWAPAGVAWIFTLLLSGAFILLVFGVAYLLSRRRDIATVFWLWALHALAASVIAYAAVPELMPAMKRTQFLSASGAGGLLLLFTLTGWAVANFWRPLNEV